MEQQKSKKLFFGNRRWLIITIVILLGVIITVCSVFAFMSKSDAEGIQDIPTGITGEEAEKWKNKKVDKDQLFIKLNTALTMKAGDKEANLALMNPPYSAYDFRVEIVLDDKKETLLYSSELIKPETYLETVEFLESLDVGNYNATVFYIFYGEVQDVVIGEHAVPVTIEVNR